VAHVKTRHWIVISARSVSPVPRRFWQLSRSMPLTLQ